jgi:hypothetical protein
MKAYKIVTGLLMALGLGIVFSTLTFAPKAGDYELLNYRFVYGPVQSNFDRYYLNNIIELLENPNFHRNRPTTIFVHSFNETYDSLSTQTVISAYLQRDEHNLLIADWGSYSTTPKVDASFVDLSSILGSKLGKALKVLLKNGLNIENTQIVGYSFGSQIAALIAQEINNESKSTIPRISALNPMNVTQINNKTNVLNSTNVQMFDVIFTVDPKSLGFNKNIGKVSFFPNGGQDCLNRTECNTERAFKLWSESVANKNNETFISIKCSSWENFKENNCENGKNAFMGFDLDANTPEGTYYLQTRKYPFYSKGAAGINYETEYDQFS